MEDNQALAVEKPARRLPCNKGKIVGAKPPLRPSHVWVDQDEAADGRPQARPRAVQSGNRQYLRAVRLLLGHSKIESTVRYLGIEVDDAIEIAEKIDI
jgi:hypothetical protein